MSTSRTWSIWASALLGVLACAPSAEGKAPDPVVRIQEGWLRGVRGEGVDRFLGIPYAAPPVGALRWRPPAPPEPWSGVRPADTLPPRCAQVGGQGSEDCLFLNVFRPTRPRRSARLPVLFYIHGGSLRVGSSFDNDPSRIAEETDTVVVMTNYRLGQFGFLAHPALGAEASDGLSGQYGLMDQGAALRWVHERIESFGGDPENVTIAGGSAGAWSVCAHLASPAVDGLIAGAVLQSGDCFTRALDETEALGLDFADAVGCPGPAAAECLRGKSTEALLGADSWARLVAIVHGGALLPEAPGAAVAAGRFQRVPVMVGGARNEARASLAPEYPLGAEDYAAFVNEVFGDCAPQVVAEYPLSEYTDPFDAIADALNDSGVGGFGSCRVLSTARTFSTYVPTYHYEFDDPDAPAPSWVVVPPGLKLGSTHGSDEVYWFDRPSDTVAPLNRAQHTLARRMVEYLGAVAEHGAPRARHRPRWPRLEAGSERTMQFRPGALGTRTDFAEVHRCRFWSSLGF